MTFGEKCRFKLSSHEPISSSGDGRTFHVGTNVGVDRRTGQYVIHRGDGIEYARTVLRFPESNKWDKDELVKVRATPWSLHVSKETELVFKDKKEIEKMGHPGQACDCETAISQGGRFHQVWSHERIPQERP